METIKEFKNSGGETYCRVEYDEKNKLLFDHWVGMFGSQDNFRKPLVHFAALAAAHKAPRGLTDNSQMIGSYDGSKEWVQKEIIPQLIKAGLRHHAMVIPKNIFAKLSTKDYMMTMKDYEVQMFDDRQKAKDWLLSK
jgi:hypothetical protein